MIMIIYKYAVVAFIQNCKQAARIKIQFKRKKIVIFNEEDKNRMKYEYI